MAQTKDTTIDDLHPDVLTHALRHLDGPALAAASCATSHLRSLSTQTDLWRDLCLTTWPSLNHLRLVDSYQSLYSRAYPFPAPKGFFPPPDNNNNNNNLLPVRLISAIDLYHRGVPILSRIVETDASTPWFHGSPFRIDGLERNDAVAIAGVSPEELTLSWVIIDSENGGLLATNVSSRRMVAVDRHWYTGETLVRFATVVGAGTERECAVGAVVACGEAGQVREVSLMAEDMDGMCLTGRESLVVIKALMEGGRTVREGEAEAATGYADHVSRRRSRKERKIRREGMLDLCCSAVGVTFFFAFFFLVVFS